MMDLKGARVVVTGGARGMGLLWARHFLADGASVALWDRDEAMLASAKAELEKAYPGRGAALAVDVTDAAAVARAAERSGPADVVVNNAGIVAGGPFAELPVERQKAIIDVNLVAAMVVTRGFLPGMIERKKGRFVNVASAAGIIGTPFMAPYNASKWGLIGFTESLKLEMRELGLRDIRFTLLCPSYVDTGMFAGVKAPLLFPMLKPEALVAKAYRMFKKNRYMILEPFMVKFVPWLKGILPNSWFNAISKLLGVTSSMAHWTGRKD